jgi:hypothetical protein
MQAVLTHRRLEGVDKTMSYGCGLARGERLCWISSPAAEAAAAAAASSTLVVIAMGVATELSAPFPTGALVDKGMSLLL